MSTPLIWHNLDTASAFETCSRHLQSSSARSFAVRFDTNNANCALDLTQQDTNDLLRFVDRNKPPPQTCWFNFWAENGDEDTVKAIRTIAKRYGVSPRLTALLTSTRSNPTKPPSLHVNHPSSLLDDRRERNQPADVDIERAPEQLEFPPKEPVRMPKLDGFGDVVEDLWHFCSVDRGPQYLYVGFNALFTVPGIDLVPNLDSSKPIGLRIWTSLLLCSDGTVVSVYEKPPSTTPQEYVSVARHNIFNIFRHLSKLHSLTSKDMLMQISVRSSGEADQTATGDAESPALLFYYLFDDWMTTYSLVAQRTNPYRDQLELVRRMMFEAASMNLIRSLDLLGRQLTVLKLMYQSYELIIHRLLRHRNLSEYYRDTQGDRYHDVPAPLLPRLGIASAISPVSSQTQRPGSGITLPVSAEVRFERLLDRIRLYALTEIEECLKQKESLVFMVSLYLDIQVTFTDSMEVALTRDSIFQNFNLVTLKESQAVEKLTRTTILLAKATILFLPVSLMTGYFSIQLSEIEKLYDLRTYWLCFLVVIVGSIAGLVVFGTFTEKVGAEMTYKSLTRTLWEKVRQGKTKRL